MLCDDVDDSVPSMDPPRNRCEVAEGSGMSRRRSRTEEEYSQPPLEPVIDDILPVDGTGGSGGQRVPGSQRFQVQGSRAQRVPKVSGFRRFRVSLVQRVPRFNGFRGSCDRELRRFR